MIETIDLGKRFDDFWAVRDVNLIVEPGQVLALLGQNGAGKTTTVRLLNSILTPSSGTARIGGFDIINQPDKVRSVVGVLTEQHGLYLRMTGRDYLDFFGQVYQINPAERIKRCDDLLLMFGLEQYGDRKIGEYSKGMRQKLALARTLIHEPPVLLLDEPTSAMDPESAKMVRDSISSLRSENRTIIICTHNLIEAEALADQVAIIYHGRILVSGSLPELKDQLLGPVEFDVLLSGRWPESNFDIPAGLEMTRAGEKSRRFRVENPAISNPLLIKRLVERQMDVLAIQEVPRTLEQVYLKTMEQVKHVQD